MPWLAHWAAFLQRYANQKAHALEQYPARLFVANTATHWRAPSMTGKKSVLKGGDKIVTRM
jgi:hypothetical protein